jgi:hypothetical protein
MTKDFKIFIVGLFTTLWMFAFFLIGKWIYPAFAELIALFNQRPLHETVHYQSVMIVFWLVPIALPILALILGISGALPGTQRKENLVQLSPGAPGKSRINLFKWASWVSLVVPLIANILVEDSSSFLFFSPEPFQNALLIQHYAFLISAIFGISVFLADVAFKRWRLFWLPLVSLILTYLLYFESGVFIGFAD